MPSWFHEILSDLGDLQVGIYFDGDDSIIETLPDREHSLIFSGHLPDNASYLKDGWISFYDYSNNQYGALNCMEHSIWSLPGEPSYIGQGRLTDSIAVQFGTELRHCALRDGTVLDSLEVSGEIVALGENWELTKRDQDVSLFLGGKRIYRFETKEPPYETVESGGYLIMIERQGQIRVINTITGTVEFEKQAPEGSEYRRAAITTDRILTYTQHIFDRPKTTIAHQRVLGDIEDLNTKEIPLSGRYHLRNHGREIFFASCVVYCSTTGELLLDARIGKS